MTIWNPDTCDCSIEISDDPATKGQAIRQVKICKVHADLGQDHNQVLSENQSRNLAKNAAESLYPSKSPVTTIEPDRSIKVTLSTAATAKQQSDIITAAQSAAATAGVTLKTITVV